MNLDKLAPKPREACACQASFTCWELYLSKISKFFFNLQSVTPHIRVVLAPPLRTNFEICASVCNVSGFYGPSYIAALLFLDEGAFLAPSPKFIFKLNGHMD